jgi:hypothetical protein
MAEGVVVTVRRPLVLAVAILTACAGSGGSGGETAEPLRREDVQVVTVSARVAAIDHDARLVTIADESGGEATFYADPAVKNLPQVKVGDELVGELVQSVVLELRAPTQEELDAGTSLLDVVATAAPGEKPAGQFVRQIRAILTVQAIDKQAGTATLVGPAGNARTIPARDPKNLDLVKVGDTVVATYTEALRLEVRAPAAE